MKSFVILLTYFFFFITFNSLIGQSLNFQWANHIGSQYSDFGQSSEIDEDGNIFQVGSFSNIGDFDPNDTIEYFMTPVGLLDIFLLKLDKDGNFVWAKQMGGLSHDRCYDITLDEDENMMCLHMTESLVKGIAVQRQRNDKD